MKVFYINIDEFKKEHDRGFLLPFCDIEYKTEKRFYEYSIGRYLLKTVAGKYYNISKPEIVVNEKGKPIFKNCDLNFSISHSKDIVAICMDKTPCGLDVEYIKEMDLKKLSKHFKYDFKNLEEFYDFWTLREAKYKLGDKVFDKYSSKIGDYYLTLVSKTKIEDVNIVNMN